MTDELTSVRLRSRDHPAWRAQVEATKGCPAPTALVPRLAAGVPDPDEQMSHLLRGSGFASWRRRVVAVGGCAKPVRLAGSTHMEDAAGVRFAEQSGRIFAPCNNRREAVCPPCAARYSGDTFHVIRSGLTGGKGVSDTVTRHVRVFATLTPPSFGPVHGRPITRAGRARACGCGDYHSEYDPRLGTAVDPDSYDYVGAVLWQAHATELWRRFTITTARHLAAALTIPVGRLREHLRISYAKVAEPQRRGLFHFHAVLRVDGPHGPVSPPPAGVTEDLLCTVIRTAVAAVRVSTPDSTVGVRELCWGRQVDTAPIAAHDRGDPALVVADMRVAGYIAKYATKGTGTTTGVDRPIRREEQITELIVSPHHRAMITTAWRLGGLPEFAGLNLRKWAHMLGFRGHFLTKSRHYSTTFTALRTARAEHRHRETLARYGITDTDGVTVVSNWHVTGFGYHTDAEREIAHAIAQRLQRVRMTPRSGRHSPTRERA
ncbi:MAG: replication initiator [Pseudonocardia sp.]